MRKSHDSCCHLYSSPPATAAQKPAQGSPLAATAPVNHAAYTPASGSTTRQNSSSLIVQKSAVSKSQHTDEAIRK